MSIVLFPEQLSEAGRAYDAAYSELKQKGARFSAEALARRVLQLVSDGMEIDIGRKLTRKRPTHSGTSTFN